MGPVVYLLGSITTLVCAVLLLTAYSKGKKPLLLWSGLCFTGLTVSYVLVFIDLVLVPTVDLFTWRLLTSIVAMGLLLYGLIWEGK